MLFEFTPGPDFDFVTSFAEKLNVKVHGDTLIIPATLGEGKIRKIDLAPDFKLIVHRYTLKEEFVLKRMPANSPHNMMSIIFNNNEVPASHFTEENKIQFSKNTNFAVQIASTALNSVSRFPANEEIYYTVVAVTISKLKTL